MAVARSHRVRRRDQLGDPVQLDRQPRLPDPLAGGVRADVVRVLVEQPLVALARTRPVLRGHEVVGAVHQRLRRHPVRGGGGGSGQVPGPGRALPQPVRDGHGQTPVVGGQPAEEAVQRGPDGPLVAGLAEHLAEPPEAGLQRVQVTGQPADEVAPGRVQPLARLDHRVTPGRQRRGDQPVPERHPALSGHRGPAVPVRAGLGDVVLDPAGVEPHPPGGREDRHRERERDQPLPAPRPRRRVPSGEPPAVSDDRRPPQHHEQLAPRLGGRVRQPQQ
ncbi:hypothetical protein [Streptomyces tendae]|uniref:hypothetical protein n=1 Tax=Streptomyces tendae TaxID=1932 RepID=UPI0036F7A752